MSARSQRGFTLVEVLVALAILGTILATVYSMVSGQLRRIAAGDEQVTLALFAENLLARTAVDLGGGDFEGSTSDGLRWRISREPVPLPPPPARPQARGSEANAGDLLGGGQASGQTSGMTMPRAEQGSDGLGSSEGNRAGTGANGIDRRGTDAPDGETRSGGEAGGLDTRTKPPLLWLVRVEVQNARGQAFNASTMRLETAP